jgi:hypothetical protein
MYMKKILVEDYLRRVDVFLKDRVHTCIVIILLSLLLGLHAKSISDVSWAILNAIVVLWFYLSGRKYGWLDTVIFIVILPLLLIGITLVFVAKVLDITKGVDADQFAESARETLLRTINKAYEGKIIETKNTDGNLHFIVETPYGLRPPASRIIKSVTDALHINVLHLHHDKINDRRSYYMFDQSAEDDYRAYRKSIQSIESFADIGDRLLLRSTRRPTQI